MTTQKQKNSSILQEINEEQQSYFRKICKLSDALGEMEPDVRSEVIAALLDKKIKANAIAKVLRRRGYTMSERTVQRCRKDCECGVLYPSS